MMHLGDWNEENFTDWWNCSAKTSLLLRRKYEPAPVSKSTKAAPRSVPIILQNPLVTAIWFLKLHSNTKSKKEKVPIAAWLPLVLQSAAQMVHSEETFPWRLRGVTMYGSSARFKKKIDPQPVDPSVVILFFLVSRFYKSGDQERSQKRTRHTHSKDTMPVLHYGRFQIHHIFQSAE